MNITVGKHEISIETTPINEKELNVTHCTFEFDEDITSDFNKQAYFTKNNATYKVILKNDECDIPNEILNTSGKVEIGVSYFKIEDNETTRYNPSPAYFYILEGSIKDNTKNGLVIKTPSELEQYENEIKEFIKEANIDIDVSKSGNVATVTTTNANGEHHSVEIYDGEQGPQGIQGIQGIQGPQGPAGRDGTNGQNGADGQDGFSPIANVVKVDTTATITITDSTGTTTTTISDGTNGTNGTDGYTPVRGTDYWTASDISTIEAYIDSKTTGLLTSNY